jgi:T5SS/PEP-CTERM-associated repeat protein
MSIPKQSNVSHKRSRSRTGSGWLNPFLSATFTLFFHCGITHAQVNWLNASGSPDPWYYAGANWSGGNRPSSTQTAQFNLASTYDVWWNGLTQGLSPSVGRLEVLAGNVTFENQDPSTQWKMIINGVGTPISDFDVAGNLTNRGVHLQCLVGARVLDGGTFTLDGSHAAGARFSAEGFDILGTFNVVSGGIASVNGGTLIGRLEEFSGNVSISGAESQLNTNGLWLGFGGWGNLSVSSGGVLISTHATLGGMSDGTGIAAVAGPMSVWNNSDEIVVGSSGFGDLTVEAGGVVESDSGIIGDQEDSWGIVTVTGNDSRWNTTSLGVGRRGEGALTLESGGQAIIQSGVFVALESSSIGTLTVNNGALLDLGTELVAGQKGDATINIASKGMVTCQDSNVGDFTGTANVTVTGIDSQWEIRRNLFIGSESFAGSATLNILDNGRVSVAGISTIRATATINLDGGRFEFGTTSMTEFESINRIAGSMAGDVTLSGFRSVGSLTSLQDSPVNLGEVRLTNQGVLYGDGNLDTALNNLAGGEVEIVAGERMRFAGIGNINAGEINNFGGTIRFAEHATNQSDGFVTGRGQFIANGGWTNSGVMAFSGPTEILGDVDNQASGLVVTSGGATTTFFDDVLNNGEIHTSAESASVFFGSASGGGSYTGTGSVYFEGDLRPGNSPGIVDFEGDLILGSLANMQVELAGLELGEFDRLEIAGDLSLNGFLTVGLLDNFNLAFNEEFLIADVGGSLFGQFTGLGEGDLVGNFGGMDLFISYTAGNGSDLALFTAVPEPGTCSFIGCGLMLAMCNRRSRRNNVA